MCFEIFIFKYRKHVKLEPKYQKKKKKEEYIQLLGILTSHIIISGLHFNPVNEILNFGFVLGSKGGNPFGCDIFEGLDLYIYNCYKHM